MEATGGQRVVTGAHPHASTKLRESYAVVMNPENADLKKYRENGMRSSKSLQHLFRVLQYSPPAPLRSTEAPKVDAHGNIIKCRRFERLGYVRSVSAI